ncbi:MAG: FG-GAP repeat protein [Candidatus Eisenbacteria bacterium]|uniref:FG-GAP repeat protein n=1 Tax=Eiseniibacteriota bacterium TaxID=2212470 RepID=A0A956SER4_UNCEI|nr:FG-GAP repeat protein [Candidatus Eisenbacteria bacterium]
MPARASQSSQRHPVPRACRAPLVAIGTSAFLLNLLAGISFAGGAQADDPLWLSASASNPSGTGAFEDAAPPFAGAGPDAARPLPSPIPDWSAADGSAGNFFGYEVSPAGDVDGDGYSDVLVSCPGLNGDDGGAFVYCGGPDGLSAGYCWLGEGTQAGRQYAISGAGAGDVNGDGYDDVLVGAWGYDYLGASNTLEGAAFLYFGSASGPSATPDWETHGDVEDMQLGETVATAGDVNGDGYDDILVGAHRFGNGLVRLFLGSPSGPSPTPDWSYTPGSSGNFGYDIATAGDVNGDGYDDIVVGSPSYGSGGRVFVFFGSGTGLSPTPDWTADGPSSSSFGSGVSTAGDVDGDGYADLVIGAQSYSQQTGRAWLYFGSASGPSSQIDFAPSLPIGAAFGRDVRAAGDVNGDGFADVLVGAYMYDGSQSEEGRAFLFLGGVNGFSGSAYWTAAPNPTAGGWFGRSVSGVGDVNGDGHGDIVIGAPGEDLGAAQGGAVHAFYGASQGVSVGPYTIQVSAQTDARLGYAVAYAGDLNGDGLGDIVTGAPTHDQSFTDEGTFLVFHGATSEDGCLDYVTQRYGGQNTAFLGTSLGRAGDVNGDGFDDLVVSAPRYATSFTNEGAVYVYQGSPSGISSSPDWTTVGGVASAFYGYSVAGAGDVNGDGFADVLVGAIGYSNTYSGQGAAFLFFGSEAGLATSPSWTVEGPGATTSLGGNVAGVGDLNGDGYSDIAVSVRGYDGAFTDEGAIFVYFGSADGPGVDPDWITSGGEDNLRMDQVAGAGDVNGDGYGDLLIGTPYFWGDAILDGRAECYFGSPSGPASTPDWTVYGGQEGAWLGNRVAAAGDVNRDGYSDVVISAQQWDDTHTDEGAIFLYHGGPGGLTFASMHSSFQQDALLGYSVAAGGDLNGDGFGDVLAGAVDYDGNVVDTGALFVYLGNSRSAPGGGSDLRPHQKSTGGTGIALLGRSDAPDRFVLSLNGRSPMGRGLVRAEWRVAETGTSLEGEPVQSGGWYDSGAPTAPGGSAASIEDLVLGLTPEALHHWQVRIRTRSLYAPASSWMSLAPAGASMAHVRTGGGASTVGPIDPGPVLTHLERIQPNPIVTSATLSLRMQTAEQVRLTAHDVTGREVATILNRRLAPGSHLVSWNGSDDDGRRLPSGLYLVRLSTSNTVEVRKVWIVE